MYMDHIINKIKIVLAIWIVIAIAASIPIADVLYFNNMITETSITETTQSILLFLIVRIYSYIAYKFEYLRYGSILIAGFFGTMFFRELDFLFDKNISWLPISLSIVIGCIFIAWRNKTNALYGLYHFMNSNAFYITVCGLGILLVFSRMIGMKLLWSGMIDVEKLRVIKNFSEEATELQGYTLCMIAAVKYFFECKGKHFSRKT